MPLKVIKFQEVEPQQKAKWYRVDTDQWPGGTGTPFDPTSILARLSSAEGSIAGLSAALGLAIDRIEVLESILLNVSSGYLLGRHSATDGAAEEIEVSFGLSLIGNRLMATTGAVDSFTLECVTDFTDHEVTCVFEDGAYNLKPNQSVSGSGAVTGIDFKATDGTNHILDLVLEDGVYNVRVNQSVGGTGSVSAMILRCASPVTAKVLEVVLADGVYNRRLS
jgi:hypothetical protein